jgi:hypothetical protein
MHTNRKLQLALCAALAAGLLSACGGGSGNSYSGGQGAPQPTVNRTPQIQGLQDQMLPQDTSTTPLAFQISDADSGADRVTVTASSSDTNVIPEAGLMLGGSGANRTLRITPAEEAVGGATITVRAVDPDGLSSERAFRISVNAVFKSFRDTTTEVFAIGESDDERTLSGFTFTLDVDDDPTAFDSLLQ